jgi:hypothetical protein
VKKDPVFQMRKRKSHVAGPWGFNWLHANEWGGCVLRGEASVRTINGFLVRMPRRYVTVLFRRRELKV